VVRFLKVANFTVFTVLKWTLGNYGVSLHTGFSLFSIGSMLGCSELFNEHFDSIKGREFLDQLRFS
jgi:hypothetical protein